MGPSNYGGTFIRGGDCNRQNKVYQNIENVVLTEVPKVMVHASDLALNPMTGWLETINNYSPRFANVCALA